MRSQDKIFYKKIKDSILSYSSKDLCDIHYLLATKLEDQYAYGDLAKLKLLLICTIDNNVNILSIREFGGLYIVHGLYLLESALRLGCSFGHMIDITPKEKFYEGISSAVLKNPDLKIEYTQSDFSDSKFLHTLDPVDVSIVYEVVLHQPNYSEVLKQVTLKTNKFICFAQPCLKENICKFPGSAILLQFLDEEIKQELRKNSWWPDEPRDHVFNSSHWMWGHTVSHLLDLLYGYGWEIDYGEVIEDIYGDYWDYALLRFKKRQL